MGPEENYYSHFEGLLTTKQLTALKKYIKGLEKEMKFFSLLGASQRLKFSHDQLDYFIARSKWNERKLNRLRCQMDVQSSQNKHYDIVVDDGGILKYTMRPYFVAKGWIGNIGKVDKCFCNVFVNFIGAEDNIPFEVETYLPSAKLAAGNKDWEFRSKLEIFIALVQRACFFAQENGLEIGRILFDS